MPPEGIYAPKGYMDVFTGDLQRRFQQFDATYTPFGTSLYVVLIVLPRQLKEERQAVHCSFIRSYDYDLQIPALAA